MIEPQFRRQQLDLLVRAANQIDCGRLAPEVRREVTSLLKLLLMGARPRPCRPRRSAMNRITPDHLARGAYVYVRQSTADQLLNNAESRRLVRADDAGPGSWLGARGGD